MNHVHAEATRLASLGYHLVPFSARRRLTDPSKPLAFDYIKDKPDMSVAIRMNAEIDIAVVPQECCVLDLEMKNGLNGIADLTKLAAQNGQTWEQVTNGCFITKTKSNGLHVWYRQPDGERLVGGVHILPGIEGKACNGTVHVPPSMGYSASVRIGSPSDCPVLPGYIADAWRGCCKKRGERLDASVSLYPLGQRRALLLSYAGTLRERAGCSIEELALMLRARRDTHCEDPGSMSDEEVYGIAKDIGRKEIKSVVGAALAGDMAAQSVMAIVKNASKAEEPIPKEEEEDHTPIVLAETEEEERALVDPLYAPPWCEPTPMFKMFQDWCRKGAVIFQPETNLLTATVAFGCIMGRTYVNHTDMRANMYALSLLLTCQGKEFPKVCSEYLLEAVDRKTSVGKDFASGAGMLAEMMQSPEMLWHADEFHSALKAWNNHGSKPYFDDIKTLLLKCWSGKTYQGRSLKDQTESPSISNPHPCVMAFCQPSTFRQYCNEELITCGFFNRFLFTCNHKFRFNTGRGMSLKDSIPKDLIPLIKSRMKETTAIQKAQNLSGSVPMGIKPGDEKAIDEISYEYQKKSAKYSETDEIRYSLYSRANERVLRLAMIHAWTLGQTDITKEGALWGCEVVNHSDACLHEIMETAGGTSTHERNVNRILNLVKRTPGVSRANLVGRGNFDAQSFDKAIATLRESNRIRLSESSRGTTIYHPCEEKKP